MKILFFGSTTDSVLVLEKLPITDVAAVVTQPPKPVGRENTLTPTPVETWAKTHNVPILSFPSDESKPWLYADEQIVIAALQPFKANLIISASYGQKIPHATVSDAEYGGINVHPSLLPRWRGADPVPWAILSGDHQTGVTIVGLSTAFDQGAILLQEKINIAETDTTDPLRAKLFTMGAALLIKNLPDIINNKIKRTLQKTAGTPYARRLTRDDGFEAWEIIQKAFADPTEAARIDCKFRAFTPWPGVWTTIKLSDQSNEKRLKILEINIKEGLLTIQTVQLEGKKPVSWQQFRKAYLSS
jgi:methionyl-tRNA formyltransferase